MTEVIASRNDGVLTLRMNRPEFLNALDRHMAAAFLEHANAAIADPSVECVVITGTGRAFCAGGDMGNIDAGTRNASKRQVASVPLLATAQSAFLTLIESHLPIITAVNGVAAGAGFGIALLGDISIASSAAKFRPAFIALGAVPDLGLAYTLPRLIGEVRARELLLTNREVSASDAVALGMVTRVVAAEDFAAEVDNAANALAASPRVAYDLTKALLRHSRTPSFADYLPLEDAAQTTAFLSPEIREGVAAFRARRKPDFRNARKPS
jgi:2-(1,2-epoxy-1,2-dihydrophenyl)acetyl-CoA isomerase